VNYGHRDAHGELLDRLGRALALLDRCPTKDNRALVDAAHLNVLDSSLRWGQGGKGVVRVVPWR
jgi:hypothetical protein